MGKRLRFGLVFVFVLGLASAVQAAPREFTGTFQITIEGSSSAALAFNGTADVSLADGSIVLPAINLSTTAAGTGPSHPIFTSVHAWATLNNSGAFLANGGPSGAMFGGDVPVLVTSLWGWWRTGTALNTGATAWVTAGFIGAQGLTATAFSSTWTTASSTFTTFVVTATGWGTGTISFTIDGRNYTAVGSDARTASRAGQIVLITPIRLWGGIPNGGLGGFATMTLDFAPVPEPGTALLLGSGLLGLVVFGRRRR